jgi:uncharacterized membrane protein
MAQDRIRVHWHAAFTHFPISTFGVAFLFQVLHFFMFREPFELATTVCVITGAFAMIPAIVTGWLTWKKDYQGARGKILLRKRLIAFSMLVVSAPLSAWRVVLYYLGNAAEGIDHYLFFFFTTLLIVGAIAEGYYGGRLTHRKGPADCNLPT